MRTAGRTSEQLRKERGTHCLSEARATETMVELVTSVLLPSSRPSRTSRARKAAWAGLLRRSGLQRAFALAPSRQARRRMARKAGSIMLDGLRDRELGEGERQLRQWAYGEEEGSVNREGRAGS